MNDKLPNFGQLALASADLGPGHRYNTRTNRLEKCPCPFCEENYHAPRRAELDAEILARLRSITSEQYWLNPPAPTTPPDTIII